MCVCDIVLNKNNNNNVNNSNNSIVNDKSQMYTVSTPDAKKYNRT